MLHSHISARERFLYTGILFRFEIRNDGVRFPLTVFRSILSQTDKSVKQLHYSATPILNSGKTCSLKNPFTIVIHLSFFSVESYCVQCLLVALSVMPSCNLAKMYQTEKGHNIPAKQLFRIHP